MWKTINVNTNLIGVKTDKAVMINMPHNSKYDGFSFWHTAKLVREGRHSAAVSISYTDEFTFHLKKYSNYKVVDELDIDAAKLEEAFKVVDENIVAPKEEKHTTIPSVEPQNTWHFDDDELPF